MTDWASIQVNQDHDASLYRGYNNRRQRRVTGGRHPNRGKAYAVTRSPDTLVRYRLRVRFGFHCLVDPIPLGLIRGLLMAYGTSSRAEPICQTVNVEIAIQNEPTPHTQMRGGGKIMKEQTLGGTQPPQGSLRREATSPERAVIWPR